MTLRETALGAPSRILGFKDLPPGERLRLSALGVREGATITKILKTPLRDPIECLVGPQLLAIESWLLDCIEVEE